MELLSKESHMVLINPANTDRYFTCGQLWIQNEHLGKEK